MKFFLSFLSLLHLSIQSGEYQFQQSFAIDSEQVNDLAYSYKEANEIAIGGQNDDTLYIWGSKHQNIKETSNFTECLEFSQDGKWLANGKSNGQVDIFLFSGTDWIVVDTFDRNRTSQKINDISFSSDSKNIAVVQGYSADIYTINHEMKWEITQEFLYPQSYNQSLACAFSQDNKYLAVGAPDANNIYCYYAKIYNVGGDWSLNKSITFTETVVQKLEFSMDNQWLAVGTTLRVEVFNTTDWRLWHSLEQLEKKQALCMKFSPDSKYILIGNLDKQFLIEVRRSKWKELQLFEVSSSSCDFQKLGNDFILGQDVQISVYHKNEPVPLGSIIMKTQMILLFVMIIIMAF